MQKLSVILPAYNKDKEVFLRVSDFVDILKKTAYNWELIVVNDASSDQTLQEAIRSKRFNGNTNRIKIYSYDLNQGKGFALRYGFTKSTGDIVVFADSDLDLPAANLHDLITPITRGNTEIVIGSKRHPMSHVKYPATRRVMSKTYQLLTKLLFNLNVSDTQVGFKAFRREVLDSCLPRLIIKQFAFDLELLVVANDLGFTRITEAPITLKYNFSSTIRFSSVLKILKDTAAIFYRKNFLHFYDTPHNSFAAVDASLKFHSAAA